MKLKTGIVRAIDYTTNCRRLVFRYHLPFEFIDESEESLKALEIRRERLRLGDMEV